MLHSEKLKRRQVNGILILDKPVGFTSNKALQSVKRIYRAQKAGHTGSLDPLATGVLPLCFGEATKFSQYLLESDKSYLVTALLGKTTDTGDADGQVLEEKPCDSVTEVLTQAILNSLKGEIMQVPSMYSALKHHGEPLYKLARQGITVERKARKVTIYELDLVRFHFPKITLSVKCSKGTYVRTLIEDIGVALGCGAHVIALKRLEAGPYRLDQAVTMEILDQILAGEGDAGLDRLLLPAASAVSHWPQVNLTQTTAYYLQQGQPVQVPKAPAQGWVRIHEGDHNFIGVGEILEDGRVAPRRLVKNQGVA